MKHHLTNTQYQMLQGHKRRTLLFLSFLLILIFCMSLFIGRYPTAGFSSPTVLIQDQIAQNIVLNLRLPRAITAVLAGAVLASSGFVFQMLFSNPLVEPGFLGVSQGAAFGAALSIVLIGYNTLMIQVSSSAFAILGLSLSFVLAKRFHFGGWILRLVLAGIAVSAFFSSGLGFIKYTADPLSELQEITFWLLGGLWNIDWNQLISILPITLISLITLYFFRWRINLLSMDDRIAHTMGISPIVEKRFILFIATIGTAAIISVSGIIGWIGLIVPHISRRIFGSNASFALPGSMLIGAIYVLFCDTLGRSLFTGELPLGIVSSLFGTFLFVMLLSSKKGLGESV